jgi:hypothetical protein
LWLHLSRRRRRQNGVGIRNSWSHERRRRWRNGRLPISIPSATRKFWFLHGDDGRRLKNGWRIVVRRQNGPENHFGVLKKPFAYPAREKQIEDWKMEQSRQNPRQKPPRFRGTAGKQVS